MQGCSNIPLNVITGWRVNAPSLMATRPANVNGCMTLNSKDGRTFFPSAIEWMQMATAHSRHVYSSTLFIPSVSKQVAASATGVTPALPDPDRNIV